MMKSSPECGARSLLVMFACALLVVGAGCAQESRDPSTADPEPHSASRPASIPGATVEDSVTAGDEDVDAQLMQMAKHGHSSNLAARTFELAAGDLPEDYPAYLSAPADPILPWPVEEADRETYAVIDDNPVRLASERPVSTFSIDVDTAAYANVRRFLNQGRFPPGDAVRVEELINYFGYHYPLPRSGDMPFSVSAEIAPAPWNDEARLLAIGIRGFEVEPTERPAANLVFLVDVSGSMSSPDKLPLLKNAFRLLTGRLDAEDRVAIVVYAGASGLVLESTPGDQKSKIAAALERLQAGGSTNGGDGIRLAYSVAADGYLPEGINRVVLATDGDFNVGTVNHEALVDLIERKREDGIALTTLGFGQGNYNDRLLEQLADHGNGNHAYIDTLNEARKVLVEELSSTLQTIAKDVKIQIEFNPAVVAEYRLIGYENRMLRREDFNNDRVDAGEIGAGHTVTALYELKLVDSRDRLIEPLRYGERGAVGSDRRELAHLRLRYKAPDGGPSRLIERPLRRSEVRDPGDTSDDFRFAAAVAAFGQTLRGGHYLGDFGLDDIEALARGARGEDPHGYRNEFVGLVALADSLGAADRVAARGPAGR